MFENVTAVRSGTHVSEPWIDHFRDVSSVELLMNNHQGIKAEIDARNDSFTTCIELGKSLLARKHYASEEVLCLWACNHRRAAAYGFCFSWRNLHCVIYRLISPVFVMTAICSGTVPLICYCEMSVLFKSVDSRWLAEVAPEFKVFSVHQMQRSRCIPFSHGQHIWHYLLEKARRCSTWLHYFDLFVHYTLLIKHS